MMLVLGRCFLLVIVTLSQSMSLMLVVIVLLLLMSMSARVTSLFSLMYPLLHLFLLLDDEMMMSYVVPAVVAAS